MTLMQDYQTAVSIGRKALVLACASWLYSLKLFGPYSKNSEFLAACATSLKPPYYVYYVYIHNIIYIYIYIYIINNIYLYNILYIYIYIYIYIYTFNLKLALAIIDLCLCEKLMIARASSASLLNKRDELVSKCRHMNKFTLKCFKNRQNIILMILFVNICSFRFRYKTNVDHLMIG